MEITYLSRICDFYFSFTLANSINSKFTPLFFIFLSISITNQWMYSGDGRRFTTNKKNKSD